jgi:predicted nucleic acid-binding Zn ribbon protein
MRLPMARRIADEDWDDDEFEGEFDGEDDDSSEDESTAPCPYCNRQIPEDAPHCPYCDNYISAEDRPPARKAWLIVLGTILTITMFVWWILRT